MELRNSVSMTKDKMFPYKIELVSGDLEKELKNCYKGQQSGHVFVGPQKWCLTYNYSKYADQYYKFDLRKDDLWIMTFPRSGTTFMQELLWLINNNLDFTKASEISLFERFPFFEYEVVNDDLFLKEIIQLNIDNPDTINVVKQFATSGWKLAPTMQSPRHFKTHLPPSLLPPNLVETCKVVYVARNPYDVAVSYYHHNKLLRSIDFQGDFNDYWNLFENDLVVYSPYWEHIKEAWNLRNHPNFLFLFYEDIIRDMPENIKKICKFLNKSITDADVDKLTKHLQLDNFRKNVKTRRKIELKGLNNPNGQSFIRRGKIGGNEEIDEKMKLKIDKWFEDNLSRANIKFTKF